MVGKLLKNVYFFQKEVFRVSVFNLKTCRSREDEQANHTVSIQQLSSRFWGLLDTGNVRHFTYQKFR